MALNEALSHLLFIGIEINMICSVTEQCIQEPYLKCVANITDIRIDQLMYIRPF